MVSDFFLLQMISSQQTEVSKVLFAAPMSASDTEARKKETMLKTTQNLNNWVIVIWRDSANYRNKQAGTRLELPYFSYRKTLETLFCEHGLLAASIIHEIRGIKRNPYPLDTYP